MFKWAVLFLVLSLIAGAMGFTNVSDIAKRISLVLFTLFFVMFLGLLLFAWLVADALQGSGVVEPSARDLIKSLLSYPVIAQHVPLDLARVRPG
jgi:uncharacterized membrane protein YtjA (UPF0391 family)